MPKCKLASVHFSLRQDECLLFQFTFQDIKKLCDVVVNISLLQPSTYFPIYIQRTSYFIFQYAKTSTFCRFVSLSIKYVYLKLSGYVTFVGLFQRYWNKILVFQISHNAFW